MNDSENNELKFSDLNLKENADFVLNFDKEDHFLQILHINKKLKFVIKSSDSIIEFEREFTFDEFNNIKVFSICDDLEEIQNILNENLRNPQNLSTSINDEGNLEIKFDISYFKKIFIFSSIIFKKRHDLNYMVEYLINENKKLKIEIVKLKEREKMSINNEYVEFKSFEISEGFYYKENSTSNNDTSIFCYSNSRIIKNYLPIIKDIKDLMNPNCSNGICTYFPGWIIIEFTKQIQFCEIKISGYRDMTNQFPSENGCGAKIYTSIDKVNWTNCGEIPSNHGANPIKFYITKSSAKFLKFTSDSYIGIGNLRIKIC